MRVSGRERILLLLLVGVIGTVGAVAGYLKWFGPGPTDAAGSGKQPGSEGQLSTSPSNVRRPGKGTTGELVRPVPSQDKLAEGSLGRMSVKVLSSTSICTTNTKQISAPRLSLKGRGFQAGSTVTTTVQSSSGVDLVERRRKAGFAGGIRMIVQATPHGDDEALGAAMSGTGADGEPLLLLGGIAVPLSLRDCSGG